MENEPDGFQTGLAEILDRLERRIPVCSWIGMKGFPSHGYRIVTDKW